MCDLVSAFGSVPPVFEVLIVPALVAPTLGATHPAGAEAPALVC